MGSEGSGVVGIERVDWLAYLLEWLHPASCICNMLILKLTLHCSVSHEVIRRLIFEMSLILGTIHSGFNIIVDYYWRENRRRIALFFNLIK